MSFKITVLGKGLLIFFMALVVIFLRTTPAKACIFNCPGIYKTNDGNFSLRTGTKSGFQFHVNYMDQKKHNFSYIKDKIRARAGDYFQQFELRDGDCFSDDNWSDCKTDRERIELSAKPRQLPRNKQCYGYSLKLSENFIDISPSKTELGQVHQIGGPSGEAGGFVSFPPLIQISADGGALFFYWHVLTGSASNVQDKVRSFRLKWLDEMLEVWTDISFCLDFGNHRIEAWVDGVQKVKLSKSPINFNLKPQNIYFKHGIYRSFISKYKKNHKSLPIQIVFYDEIRRGNSIEEVDININPSLKAVD